MRGEKRGGKHRHQRGERFEVREGKHYWQAHRKGSGSRANTARKGGVPPGGEPMGKAGGGTDECVVSNIRKGGLAVAKKRNHPEEGFIQRGWGHNVSILGNGHVALPQLRRAHDLLVKGSWRYEGKTLTAGNTRGRGKKSENRGKQPWIEKSVQKKGNKRRPRKA